MTNKFILDLSVVCGASLAVDNDIATLTLYLTVGEPIQLNRRLTNLFDLKMQGHRYAYLSTGQKIDLGPESAVSSMYKYAKCENGDLIELEDFYTIIKRISSKFNETIEGYSK